MRLKIKNDFLEEIETNDIRAKTLNVYDIDFEFSSDWEQLTKKIVFINEDDVWQEAIINNKCMVPYLPSGRAYGIGVVGYIEEEGQMTKIKSTNLIYKNITTSASELEPNKEIEEIGANTYERYLQAITAKSIEINGYLGDIEELAEQIECDKQEIAQDKIDIERCRQEILDSADVVTDMMTSLNFLHMYVDRDLKLHVVSESELSNNKFYLKDGKLGVKVNVAG